MNVLICPNAFKGSLTPAQAADALAEGVRRAAPEAEVAWLPLADGGDGTLDTLVAATGGEIRTQTVTGPRGAPVKARWGLLGDGRAAVIEMAEASGLRLLRPDEYDPRVATTFGTGELMRAALDAGAKTLLVGIGGSATNDGGAGAMTALGARFLDAEGRELPPGGAALARLARIDLSRFALQTKAQEAIAQNPTPNTQHPTILVACDVDNPLTGPEGASVIYGPQKGATPEAVAELDAALSHYADVAERTLGVSVRATPGAGAAGGLGAGLLAFCRAELRPGTEIIFEYTDFDARLAACDLILTGEGRIDGQTARGKVVGRVAQRAQQAGKPCLAFAGLLAEDADALYAQGVSGLVPVVSAPMTLEEAMQNAPRLLAEAAERAVRMWKALSIKPSAQHSSLNAQHLTPNT